MSLLFYQLSVSLYLLAIRVVAPFNIKARKWLDGRKNWRKNLDISIKKTGLHQQERPIIWMHASSLGEFEQGRPLLDALRKQQPQIYIVLSFFSPSGYEAAKAETCADVVTYLPLDSKKNARHFINAIRPSLVLWIKYDYWYFHLSAIHQAKIPLLLVSGIFRPQQIFFKWYGSLHRQLLNFFTHFFLQNDLSVKLLSTLQPADKMSVAGDTRFDRVLTIADNWQPIIEIDQWLGTNETVIVAGSTWPQDEEMLVHLAKTNCKCKMIIAPHHVDEEALSDTLKLFSTATLFSDLMEGNMPTGNNSEVLIINNIGLLSRLYHYAKICYIGGGFTGDGVHNVLEAAVYGKPVIHGPVYEKFAEAIGLNEAGGSFVVDSTLALEGVISKLLTDENLCKNSGESAKNFVMQHGGSSNRIVDFIYENRLLTNL